jgi:hypothetical protein
MFTAKEKAAQPEFWIAADQVVTTAKSGFYSQPSHRKLKKAGIFRVTLPHGRDEKLQ